MYPSIDRYAPSPNQIQAPIIEPHGGTFPGSAEDALACATSGAEIRYTINGIDPTSSSRLYSDPVTITWSAIPKAIGVKSGMDNSYMLISYTGGDTGFTIRDADGRNLKPGEDKFKIWEGWCHRCRVWWFWRTD